MRTIKNISKALRIIGIVLLCVALVLTVYAFCTNAEWGTLKSRLAEDGVKTDFALRVRFDSDYYRALAISAGNAKEPDAARISDIDNIFTKYTEKAEAGLQVQREQNAADALAFFDTEFDRQAYIDSHSVSEADADADAAEELTDYFGSFTTAGPKGKRLPVKRDAVEAALQEGYAARTAGESYVEYLTALKQITEAYVSEGNDVNGIKGVMSDIFNEDAYAAALASVQSAESSGSADSFAVDFAQALTAGESIPDFFAEAYEAHQDSLGGDLNGFIIAVRDGLDTADSYRDLSKSMTANMQNSSFGAFITDFEKSLIAEADRRASIGLVRVFWMCVSAITVFIALGIALLLISVIAEKLVTRALIRACMKRVPDSTDAGEDDVLLRVDHLKQYFRSGDYVNKAVDDVSFFIRKGEVFGLVGESGCGKTTTGRTIINLYDPTDGDVYFNGLRISSTRSGLPVLLHQLRADAKAEIEALKKAGKATPEAVRAIRQRLDKQIDEAHIHALESEAEKSRSAQRYREKRQAELKRDFDADASKLSGQALADRRQRYENEMKAASKDNIRTKMQMVFQDPIASINPRMTVREIIAEGLIIRGITDKKYIDEKVYEMLELVGLVREHADRYPHEFSGGQRQRIGIARAIVLEPDLIIADEPISALDVSIQAQVINLLNDLRQKRGLTIMFIAHNLSVVKYFSDRIGVMYYGHLVEMTTSEELFRHPLHPYTKSLLSAIPYPDPHHEKHRKRIEYNPALAHDYSVDKPTLRELAPGHFVRCNDAEAEAYLKILSEDSE